MNKYYFVIKCKKSKELKQVKMYKLEKTQDELDKIIVEHNYQNKEQYHEQVFDENTCFAIEKFENNKSNKDLEDVLDKLDDIYRDFDSVRYDIENHLEEIKNK